MEDVYEEAEERLARVWLLFCSQRFRQGRWVELTQKSTGTAFCMPDKETRHPDLGPKYPMIQTESISSQFLVFISYINPSVGISRHRLYETESAYAKKKWHTMVQLHLSSLVPLVPRRRPSTFRLRDFLRRILDQTNLLEAVMPVFPLGRNSFF